MEPTDNQLMRQVQQGDPLCFSMLTQRYQDAMLRMAESRLGRRDWAEEAVQDTLLAAFRWRMSFQPDANVRTWLWTILLNQCRRHYRLRQRAPKVETWSDAEPVGDREEFWGETLPGREPPPHSYLASRERLVQLEALLAQLDEPQADALRLRFFGGLKFREIAEALGCSLATAKNRVRWGLVRMAALMGESDAKSSRSGLGD